MILLKEYKYKIVSCRLNGTSLMLKTSSGFVVKIDYETYEMSYTAYRNEINNIDKEYSIKIYK